MGQIRLLPDHVASQVAAGEVVERPASIVKELVENSLDAGASRLEVEFARGGAAWIAVRDDGCGMDAEDALLCLERHATSKIRDASDLEGVRTMGFRGEALPSIASVSRFRLLTRVRAADSGTEILVSGGRIGTVREAGAAPGTCVEVRDLFFNVPARRKFLRGEATESAHVQQVLETFAIANPGIGLSCMKDGRPFLDLPPASDLATRLRDVFGGAFLDRMIPVPSFEAGGVSVAGFVGRAGEGRRDRQQQFIVVNGRPVWSPEVSGALREACGPALPSGAQPIAVLIVGIDPRLADCNVHPSKRVIRFSRPEAVRRAVFDAVSEALRPPAPAHVVPAPLTPAPDRPPQSPAPRFPMLPPSEPALELAPSPPAITPASGPQARYRLLGKFGRHYFAFEGDDGLVLLERRSAAERIAFERLMRQMEQGAAPCQRLLVPEVFELPAREHAWVVENADALRAAGFALEPFGGSSVKVEGLPALAGHREARLLLHEVASALRAAGRIPRGGGLRDLVARSVCRAAGSAPAETDAESLLEQLLRCELPYASPSGQPTMIQFSFAELERKFGRQG